MDGFWNKWLNRREQREYWQTSQYAYSYGWMKKTIIAVLLFAAVYEAHITDTVLTSYVDQGIRYILDAEFDVSYFTEQLKQYADLYNIDLSLFDKVKATVLRPADPLLYMQKPVDGKILVPFGWRNDAVLKREVMQEGILLDASLTGTVKAAASGTVKMVAENSQYGKVISVDHGKGIETFYGNLYEVLVAPNELVSQGQIIARVGNNNKMAIPTMYFEIHENGKAVNPLNRLRGEAAAEGK